MAAAIFNYSTRMGTACNRFHEIINSMLRFEFSNQTFFSPPFLEQSLKKPNTKTNKQTQKTKPTQQDFGKGGISGCKGQKAAGMNGCRVLCFPLTSLHSNISEGNTSIFSAKLLFNSHHLQLEREIFSYS